MKNARLQIRCTSDWYFRLCQEAQRNNMTVTQYIQTCIELGEERLRKQKTLERLK